MSVEGLGQYGRGEYGGAGTLMETCPHCSETLTDDGISVRCPTHGPIRIAPERAPNNGEQSPRREETP